MPKSVIEVKLPISDTGGTFVFLSDPMPQMAAEAFAAALREHNTYHFLVRELP